MQLPGLKFDPDHPDLKWFATNMKGVWWIALHLEADSQAEEGDSTVLIKMEAGHGYRAHRHRGSEHVLVLAGGYRDELGDYGVGEHIHYPAGSSHSPVALGDPSKPSGPENQACVLFAVAQKGIELL
jgi:anti-sigma factor ChrR (cupin superfamily)